MFHLILQMFYLLLLFHFLFLLKYLTLLPYTRLRWVIILGLVLPCIEISIPHASLTFLSVLWRNWVNINVVEDIDIDSYFRIVSVVSIGVLVAFNITRCIFGMIHLWLLINRVWMWSCPLRSSWVISLLHLLDFW